MRVVVAIIGLLAWSPALGQSQKAKFDDQLTNCVATYTARYAALCETADVAARGVAYACAPKPRPKTPAYETNKGLQWDYVIEETAHEAAYAKALVGILDSRSQRALDCEHSKTLRQNPPDASAFTAPH
jgi:hypothetical protein